MTWQIWHNWNILVFLFMKIASLSELINREHINNTLRGLAMPLPCSHPCLVSLRQGTAQNLSPWLLCPSPADWALNSGWFFCCCLLFVCLFVFSSDFKLFTNTDSQVFHIFISCTALLTNRSCSASATFVCMLLIIFFPGLMARSIIKWFRAL